MVKEINTIGVVGAGTMGSGIAQVAAAAGFQVILRDVSEAALDRGFKIIERSLGKLTKKEKLTEEQAKEILARITKTLELKDMAGADLVIEAAFEKMEVKKELFGELDKVCRPEVVLASNTSSLSITEIAATTSRPDKVVGMHFFNPVPVLPLVEIVQGLTTSDETVELAYQVALKLGKSPIKTKDQPGFIVNRILVPYMNEAAFALMEGVGTAEEIDQAMKWGASMPIGPLALFDLVGIDVALDVLEVLYREFGDPKFRPAPILRQMVRAGHLGRKTGKGFFDYTEKV
jgi:3-hydroxybutyryl-CoA dehydrogenase